MTKIEITERPERLCDGVYLATNYASTPAQHEALRAIRYGSVHRPRGDRDIGYEKASIADCYEEAGPEARLMMREAFGVVDLPDPCDVRYRAPAGTPSEGVYFRARSRADAESVLREAQERAEQATLAGWKDDLRRYWIERARA